ncbi:MAG: universal stress protein [Bacteriovoracaceae bacterium]
MLDNDSHILVCTDFSDFSNWAVKAGAYLKSKTGATLHVLHVNDFPLQWDWVINEAMTDYLDERFNFELMNISQQRLRHQLSELQVQAIPHVLIGFPSYEIQQFIKDKKINLVIIGHKGKGNSIFNLGSLAAKILASSSIPTLIVKKEFLLSKIAGLVDSSTEMKEIIEATEKLGKIFTCPNEIISLIVDIESRFLGIGKVGFSTKLLSLSDEDKKQLIKEVQFNIRSYLKKNSDTKVKVELTVERKISYQLNSILLNDHVDLVVMKRHQSDLLKKILIGSETRRMIEIFDGHLLILPP